MAMAFPAAFPNFRIASISYYLAFQFFHYLYNQCLALNSFVFPRVVSIFSEWLLIDTALHSKNSHRKLIFNMELWDWVAICLTMNAVKTSL